MFFHGFSLAWRIFTLLRKKLKYFPFFNLHRRLISFIYIAGILFFSLQWCLGNIIRQECQFKRNLCRILKITDVDAPQEGANLNISAALSLIQVVNQLLRSSSVAVSTSHDFEDKATITAFCREEKGDEKINSQGNIFKILNHSLSLYWKPSSFYLCCLATCMCIKSF